MSISNVSPVSTYISAIKNETAAAETYAKTDATTRHDVATFEKNAASITSADGLLKNYSVLQVVLGAYGLSSLSNAQAIVKDLLTQDPTSSKSLAKSSNNAAWLAFADAFKTWGQNKGTASVSPFADTDTASTIVSQFEMSQYENSDNLQDNGVGNALYFTRKMTGVTSLAQVMSDPTLLKVVETVSGYDPSTFGTLDYDQQVQMLKGKVDFTTLKTPEQIQQYAERYLAMLQITPQPSDKPATMMDLLGGDTGGVGIAALFGVTNSSSASGGLYSGLF